MSPIIEKRKQHDMLKNKVNFNKVKVAMKSFIINCFRVLCMLFVGVSISAQQNEWPVLKTYEGEYTKRIAMPVGGIGTGTISLNGRGGLQDWEIMNRPAKGFNPYFFKGLPVNRFPFFAIYINSNDNKEIVVLEGPLSDLDFVGSNGAIGSNHGLPRFDTSVFQTAYPFGQVTLKDEKLPVEVTVGAFNPLIPGDTDNSSIPMAVLSYTVKNTSDKPMVISIAGNIPNFIGTNGYEGNPKKNIISYREENGIKGLHYSSDSIDLKSPQWGTFSLISLNKGNTTYRTNWSPIKWGDTTLDFWDDFGADGLLENRSDYGADAPMGSLATKTDLAVGETKELRFLITWHFPNRTTWVKPGFHKYIPGMVGNYYASKYEDSWDVVVKTIPQLEELENKTKTFIKAFIESDMPEVVKEAALFNLAHLRTQLAFRTATGHLLGWEGTFEKRGAGFGSCNHVWNYEQVTPFLFGELAKTMRDVELGYATADNGLMSFRAYLPLNLAQKWDQAAADGQMGAIMKFYREWQLSGDDKFLKKHWSMAKKALEFCWIKGGWDANKDGVMEGAQHNTMDVEYFGPNPQMGFWYLGALKATEEMANYLGEKKFAKFCKLLYKQGSEFMDDKLFNGEYYEQIIEPPMVAENIAPGLMHGKGAEQLSSPDYQLGKGVLVDQFVGQVMAHSMGLGYLANKENIRKANKAIVKYNRRGDLSKHANFMRSYALGNESALLMAGYPAERPEKPFPYFTEVMTGFEYTAAVNMLYENQDDIGLRTMQDVRNRYDGKKRNPFNEAEFGNHYARAMMAWGAVLAITGFNYSAVDQSMQFNATNGTYFWSNGYQYGTIKISS
ncbi:GH116 family glycosyl-hydrolase [Paraglaciecola sp.]|uniref:GH116 family glycosyl-hydrolase n=1 Tax=Paraglaciecola sp. TaxID=1920173 RepID=UPI003EF62572